MAEKEGLGGAAEKSIKENPKVLTHDEGGGDLGPTGHFWVHSGEMIRSQPTQGPGHALQVPQGLHPAQPRGCWTGHTQASAT